MSFSGAKVTNFVEMVSILCHKTLFSIRFCLCEKTNTLKYSIFRNLVVENFFTSGFFVLNLRHFE